MPDAWPAICTAVALGLLLYLIIHVKFQAFAALILVSLGLGIAAGMPPEGVLLSIGKGIGDILKEVAVILVLGAMLGRMLEASGAAEVIARTLVNAFGVSRASWAILVAGYLVGIPVLFNVGFLLLIPIMWRLQRETGQSLLWFILPLNFSLATMHSLVPPHPGIVGAVNTLGADMVQTIIFGALMGIPIVLVGWLGPGRWWARREFIDVPEHLMASEAERRGTGETERRGDEEQRAPSFFTSVLIVTLPLLLSLLGFGMKLLGDLERLPREMMQPIMPEESLPFWLKFLAHSPVDWLRFLGHPTMALLIPTGLAFWLLGMRRGMSRQQLSKVAENAIHDVGGMALLFGGAGAFKQIIQDTKAGEYIAGLIMDLPLSPIAVAFFVAVLMRIALGSATASILTASALLAGLAKSLPGQETVLVLAVANGVTFMTQPGDSGFWLVKEYCNLSVKQLMINYNSCRITMSLTGLALLLAYEAWFS